MPGVSGLALEESLGIPLCLTLPCLPAPGWQVQYHPHDHQRGLRGGTHGSGEYLSPPPPSEHRRGAGALPKGESCPSAPGVRAGETSAAWG